MYVREGGRVKEEKQERVCVLGEGKRQRERECVCMRGIGNISEMKSVCVRENGEWERGGVKVRE